MPSPPIIPPPLRLDNRTSSSLFAAFAFALPMAGCGRPVLTVDDAIADRRGRAELVAYVEREPVLGLRRNARGVEVHFQLNGQEAGEDRSDDNGRAHVRVQSVPRGARQFTARATVGGTALTAPGRIFHWPEEPTIVAVDIDDTLAQTEYKALIFEESDESSDPHKGARAALEEIAGRHGLVYFTARPRFLLNKTRAWLAGHHFPAAPVITAPGLRQWLRQGEYKRRALRELRRRWSGLRIGIGDQPADAAAYGANDMLAIIVHPDPRIHYGQHAVLLKNWKAVARFFRDNGEVLGDQDALEKALEGKRELCRPIVPYEDE